MGGGDLNMKKSWHPGLIKNRAQVWEDQHAALQERKRIEALKKEIEEERAANELQKLNEANGGAKRQERVEFLYAGPGAGSSMAEDREAYLLGRKRIDDVLGKDSLGGSTDSKTTTTQPSGPNMRDVSNKVALDPLLAIKKQEAAQYKAMIDKKKAEMEAEARREARRAVKRSQPQDDRHRRSSRRDDDDDRRHRRRSSSRDRHYESRRYERKDRPERRRYDSRERYSRPSRKTSSRRRSDSTSSHGSIDRLRSRRDDNRYDHSSRYRAKSRSRSPHHARRDTGVKVESSKPSQSAAERLAAMTESAKDLDDMRARRLQESNAKELVERQKDDAGRTRHSLARSGFLQEMQQQDTLVS